MKQGERQSELRRIGNTIWGCPHAVAALEKISYENNITINWPVPVYCEDCKKKGLKTYKVEL